MSDHHDTDDGCLDGVFEFGETILETDSPWWVLVLTLLAIAVIVYIHLS